ncbi:hypothetical protein KBY58_04440, partial [Cyanobium sp. HWJ4-Hawea]|uniref:hypothetical protein n=1 Tax=Cyanobium sp. HWJ4-Hawea TaxID=2823713 RepID=UPI0020CEC4BE
GVCGWVCVGVSAIIPGDGRHCHGFIALEESVCLYISSASYSQADDKGFDMFSLPFDFANLEELHQLSLLRSRRDTMFKRLIINA